MDKYFKRKSNSEEGVAQENDFSKQSRKEVNIADLPADPGLRPRIFDYHPNDRDQIRRAYLQRGPCQPRQHDFPRRHFGNSFRRFNPNWFDEHHNWLEYSIHKDAAFCLCCYLFKSGTGDQGGGHTFVTTGFDNWKKKERFQTHVGGPNSSHNQARRKCEDLMKQMQHIETIVSKPSECAQIEYGACLNASIDCIRFLLTRGLAFCGHNESEGSIDQGYFFELLHFLANHCDEIKGVVLQNALGNLKLTSPDFQKDIVSAAAIETTNAIMNELGDALFSILMDESCDISNKEQVTIILRYVDKQGHVIERFLGIVDVSETTALSLKAAIETLFFKHGLSIARLRGQGFIGASNMRDEFNGLKTLIMNENGSAYHIHCFAHQLQLALVGIAKNNKHIALLFSLVAKMVNVVGYSYKCRDILQVKRANEVIEALRIYKFESGQGLNQESDIKRAGDTRWGLHYGALMNLINLYSPVMDVLEIVEDDGSDLDQGAEATIILRSMQSFDFAFSLFLMKVILGITHELSRALQRKEHDIVNAMTLVEICKQRLQKMRDDGWDALLTEVSSFCVEHDINIPDMDAKFVAQGRLCRKVEELTNGHYYRVDIFYSVIDMQFQELNNRFTEVNTELLLCLACLNPSDSFHAFSKEKLIRFAKFYPFDFSVVDLMMLDNQLQTFILDMHSNSEFAEVKGIVELAEKMVDSKKNILYPLVYKLVTLTLILPIAAANVERAFSAMNIVKNQLRNGMGDQWMNDCLVTYIEKDVFDCIDNETIINHFQSVNAVECSCKS